MTQTFYGWIVLKKDGVPYKHRQTEALASFDEEVDARTIAKRLVGSRVVPCTIQYEV